MADPIVEAVAAMLPHAPAKFCGDQHRHDGHYWMNGLKEQWCVGWKGKTKALGAISPLRKIPRVKRA